MAQLPDPSFGPVLDEGKTPVQNTALLPVANLAGQAGQLYAQGAVVDEATDAVTGITGELQNTMAHLNSLDAQRTQALVEGEDKVAKQAHDAIQNILMGRDQGRLTPSRARVLIDSEIRRLSREHPTFATAIRSVGSGLTGSGGLAALDTAFTAQQKMELETEQQLRTAMLNTGVPPHQLNSPEVRTAFLREIREEDQRRREKSALDARIAELTLSSKESEIARQVVTRDATKGAALAMQSADTDVQASLGGLRNTIAAQELYTPENTQRARAEILSRFAQARSEILAYSAQGFDPSTMIASLASQEKRYLEMLDQQTLYSYNEAMTQARLGGQVEAMTINNPVVTNLLALATAGGAGLPDLLTSLKTAGNNPLYGGAFSGLLDTPLAKQYETSTRLQNGTGTDEDLDAARVVTQATKGTRTDIPMVTNSVRVIAQHGTNLDLSSLSVDQARAAQPDVIARTENDVASITASLFPFTEAGGVIEYNPEINAVAFVGRTQSGAGRVMSVKSRGVPQSGNMRLYERNRRAHDEALRKWVESIGGRVRVTDDMVTPLQDQAASDLLYIFQRDKAWPGVLPPALKPESILAALAPQEKGQGAGSE